MLSDDLLIQLTVLVIVIGGLSKCFCYHSEYKNPNKVVAIYSKKIINSDNSNDSIGVSILHPIRKYYEPVLVNKFETEKRVTLGRKWITSLAISSAFKRYLIKSAYAIDDQSFYETWIYQNPADIMPYIFAKSIEGNAESVLKAMDQFASYYPMYKLTPAKADILRMAVVSSQPSHILEIGSFLGYSAIKIASSMPSATTLTCIEGNPQNVVVINELLRFAFRGREEILKRIRLITGISTSVIAQAESAESMLPQNSNSSFLMSNVTAELDSKMTTTAPAIPLFDFVFLDHDKDCYRKDLQLLDTRGFLSLRPARLTVVADNVVFPGAPGFLEAVGLDLNASDGSNSTKKEAYISVGDISTFFRDSNVAIRRGDEGGDGASWSTKLVSTPFERKGFETQFQTVEDAMSVSIR